MAMDNFEKIPTEKEVVSITVGDGPGAAVRIEPHNPEESTSNWAVSLCIDFTPVHPKERMLRIYLSRAEANDVAMAILNAVNVGYKPIP